MHIVLYTASYAPRMGGVETAVARLAREARAAGHRVTVITNRYPRSLPAFERIDGVAVHRILFPAPLVPRSEWEHTHMGKFILLWPFMPWALLRLWLLIRSLRPDVVNVHYLSTPAFYIGLLAQMGLLPARVVISFHGSDLTTVPYPTGSPRISRWILSQAQAVTACSSDLAHYVSLMTSRIPGSRVHVVYNGTDPDEFAGLPPHTHPRPYIFTAGRLVEKKGMHFLIEALRLVRDRGFDCDLLIAGGGPEEEPLRALAAGLDLAEHVHLVGPADRRRLGSYYHGCALFALAPVWEGFGIVSLEAMSCARAVVATRTGGIPEVVVDGQTGLLARPADPTDLADQLCALLGDAQRAATMGRRGRERVVELFTWPSVAARYLTSYAAPGEGEPGPASPTERTELAAQSQEHEDPNGAPAAALAPNHQQSVAASSRSVPLDELAAHAGELLGAHYAAIALQESDCGTSYRGIWGARSEVWRTTRFPPGRGFPNLVIAAGQTLVAEGLGRTAEYHLDELPWHLSEGGRTAAGVPLMRRGEAVGALVVGWRVETAVSPRQRELLEKLAAQIAALPDYTAGAQPMERGARSAAVPILMYHQVAPLSVGGVKRSLLVTPPAFAAQMSLLYRLGWRTLRLVELVSLLDAGADLPRRRFVLTFDDAYRGVAQHAVPVLRRLGFSATVFVPTALAGTCRALDGGPDSPEKAIMSWDELRAMRHAGLDLAAHTCTHPHLPALPFAEAAREIAGSRVELSEALGEAPLLFAYPYGEWTPAVAVAVHEAGFVAACATRFGRASLGSHRFALPRISVGADLDLPHFAYRLAFAERIAHRAATSAVPASLVAVGGNGA